MEKYYHLTTIRHGELFSLQTYQRIKLGSLTTTPTLMFDLYSKPLPLTNLVAKHKQYYSNLLWLEVLPIGCVFGYGVHQAAKAFYTPTIIKGEWVKYPMPNSIGREYYDVVVGNQLRATSTFGPTEFRRFDTCQIREPYYLFTSLEAARLYAKALTLDNVCIMVCRLVGAHYIENTLAHTINLSTNSSVYVEHITPYNNESLPV